MPHIIVEYSRNIGDVAEISDLVLNLHNALADAGIDKARIKTRAVVSDYVAVGEHELHGHMLHTTLLLLEGRDVPTKDKYGQALFKQLNKFVDGVFKDCAISLEVRDMSKDTYYQ